MSDIELDYESLMQSALRRVVSDVLSITAELQEAPGDHHFYIEFLTRHDGVDIPDYLRDSYPERMTIVLHHQFKDLQVTPADFSVTVWFKGVEARLTIPFEAVTSFADPSVKYQLVFLDGAGEGVEDGTADDASAKPAEDKSPNGEADPSEDGDDDEEKSDSGAEVVSLDAFRKK